MECKPPSGGFLLARLSINKKRPKISPGAFVLLVGRAKLAV